MIKIPSVTLAVYGVFVGSCCLGFLDATLEPHLRQVYLYTNKIKSKRFPTHTKNTNTCPIYSTRF